MSVIESDNGELITLPLIERDVESLEAQLKDEIGYLWLGLGLMGLIILGLVAILAVLIINSSRQSGPPPPGDKK